MMSQTLAKIYLHIIFSTKKQQAHIHKTIEKDFYTYIDMLLKAQGSIPEIIGGMPDHVHILCLLPKTQTVSKLIEEVKTKSSLWLQKKGLEYEDFSWQEGYGVFSVSYSQIAEAKKYIANQATFHKKMSFQDEFLLLLKKFEVEYEEKYLWN